MASSFFLETPEHIEIVPLEPSNPRREFTSKRQPHVIHLVAAWKQKDIFPIILRRLVDISEPGKWVGHSELVSELAKSSIQDIRSVCSGNPSPKIVSNMLAWFSQKVSAYQNGRLSDRYAAIDTVQEASARFERRKERSSYSYRLRTISET